MTDEVAPTEQGAAEPDGPVLSSTPVEIVIDGYRVTGELRSPGAPRRLVDILNLSDEPSLAVHDGVLDTPLVAGDEPRRFGTVLVHRQAVLFAVPRSTASPDRDPYDVLDKEPVAVTLHMPGFEVSGNVHLLPGVDPLQSNLLGSRHFVPVTDVTVRAGALPDPVWQEPVIAVNFAHVRTFAPRPA